MTLKDLTSLKRDGGVEAMTPRVLNFRDFPRGQVPPNAVRIDRKTELGNPFPIGRRYGDRAAVLRLHERWFARQGELIRVWLPLLHGRDVICWCAPLPCHGDLYVRLAAMSPLQVLDWRLRTINFPASKAL